MTGVAADVSEVTQGANGRRWRRREVLAGSAAAAMAICAGCTSAATPVPASSPSASSPTGSSSPSAQQTTLASVADIPVAGGLVVIAPSGPLLLAKSGGKVVAHRAVCTHQGATIDGAGVCPLHGSKFDVLTGSVLDGPATEPLVTVAVSEVAGQIVLG